MSLAGPTRLGDALLAAVGLETTALEDYLARVGEEDAALAAELRRRLDTAAALPSSFLAVPAAQRLGREPAERGLAEESARLPRSSPRHDPDPDGDWNPVSAAADSGSRRGETRSAGRGGQGGEGLPSEIATVPLGERYLLGECLGQGGMARVFAAHDRQLGRAVALKFLTRREPAIVARFLREARAQARVRHDHVLEVYDSGELGGQPFIAMRHVAGPNLGQLRGELALEQQVALLIEVAEGLHAAHGKGLIHRDVKPSNVLVETGEDGGRRAYVADFGIASEAASRAADGGLVGTPAYIAPELLAAPGDPVDRRSDVYSLGVCLYELFTGRRPFSGDDPAILLRQVLRAEPPSPRSLRPGLPADLEAVVLRAMAKDPAQRYPSARALADDLRRFLAGEVVEAYGASWAYRLQRFATRHRRLVAAAAVTTLLLLAAAVAIAFFAGHAENERRRAEARRAQAEELIGFLLGDLREKLASAERLEILDEVNRSALDYFAAVPAAELSDAELATRSKLLYQIGDVRIRKGDLAGAVAPLEDSLRLAKHLAERHPGDGARLFDLGQSYYWLGYVRWRQADPAGARAPFEGYLQVARELAALDPENLDWQLELSYAYSNLGSAVEDLGDPAAALKLFESNLEIDRKLVARDPENAEWIHSLAGTRSHLGEVLRALGRLGEAEAQMTEEVELRRRLAAAAGSSLRRQEDLGTSLEQLGGLLLARGEVERAATLFAESRAIFEDLTGRDRENSQWWYKLAWSRIRLGQAAAARGERAAARAEHRAAGEILGDARHAKVDDPFWRRSVAANLQHLAAVADEPREAEALARQSIASLEKMLAEKADDRRALRWLGAGWLLLGDLLEKKGEGAAAREAWEKAVAALAPAAEDQSDGRRLAPYTEALLKLGRDKDARTGLEALAAQGYVDPGLRKDPRRSFNR